MALWYGYNHPYTRVLLDCISAAYSIIRLCLLRTNKSERYEWVTLQGFWGMVQYLARRHRYRTVIEILTQKISLHHCLQMGGAPATSAQSTRKPPCEKIKSRRAQHHSFFARSYATAIQCHRARGIVILFAKPTNECYLGSPYSIVEDRASSK